MTLSSFFSSLLLPSFFLVYPFLFSFFNFLSPSVCVQFSFCLLPNYSLGRNWGKRYRACLGRAEWGCLIFPCAFKQRWESAEEELEGRGCLDLGLVCRGPDKASVMITTGWRRPGVPTPRVLNGSLGNLIGGNSRRFCVPIPRARRPSLTSMGR